MNGTLLVPTCTAYDAALVCSMQTGNVPRRTCVSAMHGHLSGACIPHRPALWVSIIITGKKGVFPNNFVEMIESSAAPVEVHDAAIV